MTKKFYMYQFIVDFWKIYKDAENYMPNLFKN